jgi:DNA replication and repair protein RecF
MNSIKLNKIILRNWRNYEILEKDINPGLNEIIGPNGSGKTNLLEAIFFNLKQYSFRVSDNKALIKKDCTEAKAELIFSSNSSLSTKLKLSGGRVQKRILVDGEKKLRITNPSLQVVMFEPNLSLMISGEKQLRRDLVDEFAGVYSPAHQLLIKNYKRALLQRNNILKRHQKINNKNLVEDIFVWDLQLSSVGAKIIVNRLKALSLINNLVENKYGAISSKNKDKIKLIYISNIEISEDEPLMANILLNQLNSRINKDAIIGHTTCGPHRDDVEFNLNNKNAQQSASRGEARSIVIALKLIEIEEIKRISTHPPIILLDDIYSELDSTRQTKLKKELEGLQVVVTGV